MGATVKLALIGCGAIAGWHVNALANNPRVVITDMVDPVLERAETLAARVGARAHASLEEALANGDFDAAVVLVPPGGHESVSLALFAAGKHVLLEKPMANTVEACERIEAAGASSGRVFMVAENAQYWPEVVIARRLLEEGLIGERVSIRSLCAVPPMEQFYRGADAWRKNAGAAGGGVTLDVGSHWVRPLRMLMGEVAEVVACVDRPYAEMEGESLLRSLVRFESGLVGSFDAYITLGPVGPEPRFRITGAKGEITADQSGSVLLYNAEFPQGKQMGDGKSYMDSYVLEHEDFAAAILDGTALAAGPEAAIGDLKTVLAMYRSAESRGWEKV